MAVRPRIGPSGSERASGSAENLTGISIVRWTARSMLVVAAAFAILLGVTDVVAIRSGEYPPCESQSSLNFKSNRSPSWRWGTRFRQKVHLFRKCLSVNRFWSNLLEKIFKIIAYWISRSFFYLILSPSCIIKNT